MLAARVFLVLAGLLGAAGVAAAAGASHGESRNLSAIAMIFLAHAPVLLVLALYGRGRMLLAAGFLLAIGTALFGADLAMRECLGHGLFPGATPLAGGAMILGWLALAVAGLFGRFGSRLNKD
ncbi:DUF423 domain-containing protein [Devosia sediminis]|uniref:DUF423 domain-containing protein n=1 Tax=Devosia sediminis TaxID=2798801 RepID=A0A934IT22_9HYPH|nr:DUF423 domain-containing protein [Devosia sediminis]MBJ3783802.1 DUF423 domain-containing protein [Devosia sediminis]